MILAAGAFVALLDGTVVSVAVHTLAGRSRWAWRTPSG
ncbi:hypothetical protein HNR61_003385 [Actinomadura namibiensis]|uniref:Uncharacterized protein n=1 Tax=Actinomadura namibiensis TaxID=182080 RepID=A0A7W3QLP5_ACTNM|nr:hypothetical protein [Actinomadura namibiensis]